MKVLLIEDDEEIAAFIERGLREQGYCVRHETTSQKGIISAASGDFDVIIFDRLLPGMDGIDAVRILRQSKLETPILMLTALSAIGDRVAGLEAGADDYMVKPFVFAELHARLKALARRRPLAKEDTILEIADLRLDRTTREITRSGKALDLLPREYQILEYLMLNPGQLVTRTMLLEQIWGFQFDPKTSLVQTHVSRLRSKIDKPFDVELIKTLRGSGYLISAS
jgi:two-component system OmpR family response regulator